MLGTDKFGPYGLAAILAVAVSACASTVSNFDALEIAGTYDTILTKQVVFNIYKTLQNEYGVPAFVKISTQTNQVTEGVTATPSFPLSSTATLAQSAAFLTTGRTLATAGAAVSLPIQAQRVTNYTISPINDPDMLRRMRSVYQYATGYLSQFDFESDYPIIQVSAVAAAPASSSISPTIVSGKIGANPFNVAIGPPPPGSPPPPGTPKKIQYFRRVCVAPSKEKFGECGQYDFAPIKPDTTFVNLPGCIMCDLSNELSSKSTPTTIAIVLQKNPKLWGRNCLDVDFYKETTPCKNEFTELFFYRPDEPIDSNAIPVSSNGLETLYLRPGFGPQAFYELTLFTQEASSQGTGSPSSGGQSEGRKNPSIQTISGPGNGLTFQ